jgi:hypothetical protein
MSDVVSNDGVVELSPKQADKLGSSGDLPWRRAASAVGARLTPHGDGPGDTHPPLAARQRQLALLAARS